MHEYLVAMMLSGAIDGAIFHNAPTENQPIKISASANEVVHIRR